MPAPSRPAGRGEGADRLQQELIFWRVSSGRCSLGAANALCPRPRCGVVCGSRGCRSHLGVLPEDGRRAGPDTCRHAEAWPSCKRGCAADVSRRKPAETVLGGDPGAEGRAERCGASTCERKGLGARVHARSPAAPGVHTQAPGKGPHGRPPGAHRTQGSALLRGLCTDCIQSVCKQGNLSNRKMGQQ